MKPCVGQLWYYLIYRLFPSPDGGARAEVVVSRPVSDLVDYSSFRRLVVFPGGNLDPRRLRSSYNSAA